MAAAVTRLLADIRPGQVFRGNPSCLSAQTGQSVYLRTFEGIFDLVAGAMYRSVESYTVANCESLGTSKDLVEDQERMDWLCSKAELCVRTRMGDFVMDCPETMTIGAETRSVVREAFDQERRRERELEWKRERGREQQQEQGPRREHKREQECK